MGPWSPTGQSCGLQPDAHGKAAWPGDGCPCSPELSAEAVPAIPQVTVLSHEFLVVWVKFNAPWPQGTGHSCWTQAGPRSQPLRSSDSKHSLSVETPRPDHTLHTEVSLLGPEWVCRAPAWPLRVGGPRLRQRPAGSPHRCGVWRGWWA